jgi:hypothetical protein
MSNKRTEAQVEESRHRQIVQQSYLNLMALAGVVTNVVVERD